MQVITDYLSEDAGNLWYTKFEKSPFTSLPFIKPLFPEIIIRLFYLKSSFSILFITRKTKKGKYVSVYM